MTLDAGICVRDRALGLEGASLTPAAMRMVGLAAAEVSFAKTSELLRELAGVHVESKQVERAAEALGRAVADDERDVAEPVPGPALTDVTWGWTAPACRWVQPRSKAAAASSPTVRPRPARPSWSPCGRPKHETRRAGPFATPGRSATTPRSRARPPATPTRSRPPSHNASIARRSDVASTPRSAGSSWATAPRGSDMLRSPLCCLGPENPREIGARPRFTQHYG